MSEGAPVLRVVSGSPSAEELAVLTALMATPARPPSSAGSSHSRWADPASRLRRPLRSGPGAWAASARPR